VENPLHAGTGRINRLLVGNIRLDDFKASVIPVLLQIGAPADDEIVKDSNVPTLIDQPIDEVASNEACATRYQIEHDNLADSLSLAFAMSKPDNFVLVKRRVENQRNALWPSNTSCFCLYLLGLDFKEAHAEAQLCGIAIASLNLSSG
jgi:hypothetical protein